MVQAASEVTCLVRLLEELGVKDLTPITPNCDNQSTLHIADNPVFHERTKHIELTVISPETKSLKDNCNSTICLPHLRLLMC